MTVPHRFRRSEAFALGEERHVFVGELIGNGASSSVFRAILQSESGLQRAVAIKVFAPVGSDDKAAFAKAIGRAAQRTASISHPNVAALYELGDYGETSFLVSELVLGASLKELQHAYVAGGNRMPLDVALFVAGEVAHALEGGLTARDAGGHLLEIVHLGLTPSEILLSWRGEVKVTDFEISLARFATSSIHDLDDLRSRLDYLAPEIAEGGEGDARSDVFALGLVLRELLIGPRFPADISSREAVRLAREGYVHAYPFQRDLPSDLAEIIRVALDIDPKERFQDAAAFGFELRRTALAMGVGDGRWFLRRVLGEAFPNRMPEAADLSDV